MKRTLLRALVLVFLPYCIGAQESVIEIDSRIFDNAVRSLLLLSDEDGVVQFEEELVEPEFSENHRVNFIRDPEVGAYHFTIFNEYISENRNIGYRYYQACTYYDIADELTADNFYDFGPGPELKVETREVLIEVNGVDELNEFIVHASTPLNYERAKVRKGRLRIQYEHDKGSDLFIVLRCNDEENYRYLYYPENAIPAQAELDWASLSQELEYKDISLPIEDSWFSRVRARNEDTQGYCHLFSSMGGYRDQIRLFLPRKYFFYDYDVFLARHRKENKGVKSFQYHLHGDEIPLVEPIDEADYDYTLSRADKNGFEITGPDQTMQFKVRYQGMSFRPFQSRSEYRELKFSSWYVVGSLEKPVYFTFPNIPLYHEANFESLKSIGGRDPQRMQVIKPLGGKNRIIVAAPIER